MGGIYDLTANEKQKVSQQLREIRKEETYEHFIKQQEKGFELVMNYIAGIVYQLQEKGEVTPFMEIRARIKAVEAALDNAKPENMKLLDDIFGIELICANEQEIKVIKKEIEKVMRSTRNKDHNKKNGYKAIHRIYSVRPELAKNEEYKKFLEETVPAVECQYKTVEVKTNPQARHYDYKNVNQPETQKTLEESVLVEGKELPKMWINKEGKMYQLPYKEVVRRVYPFVDLTRIKEPEKEEKENEK